MNETQQQIRSATQAGKPLIQPLRDLLGCLWRGVGEVRFHVAMTILFGIEFGRILRQWLDADLRMLKQEAQGLGTGMNMGMIANQDEPSRAEAQHMLQAPDEVLAGHRPLEPARVDVARHGQAHGHGHTAPLLGHPTEPRSFATGRPRPTRPLQEGVAEFIEKHDVHATSPRLFLSVASPESATHGSPPRRARQLGSVVVAGSSRCVPAGVGCI